MTSYGAELVDEVDGIRGRLVNSAPGDIMPGAGDGICAAPGRGGFAGGASSIASGGGSYVMLGRDAGLYVDAGAARASGFLPITLFRIPSPVTVPLLVGSAIGM